MSERERGRESLKKERKSGGGRQEKKKERKTSLSLSLTGEQGVEGALRALHEEGARKQGLVHRGRGRREEHVVGHLLVERAIFYSRGESSK